MWNSEEKRFEKLMAESDAEKAKEEAEMEVAFKGGNTDDFINAGKRAYDRTMKQHGFHQTWRTYGLRSEYQQLDLIEAEYEAKKAQEYAEMEVDFEGGNTNNAIKAGKRAYDHTMKQHGFHKTWE